MRLVAVFDTNVLFSAVGWRGRPYQCLQLARANAVEGITCQELLVELGGKLGSKLALDPEQIVETLAELMTFLRIVQITGNLKAVGDDPDDDKVLECAIATGATHIVTGDRRHLLPLGSFHGVSIVTVAAFLTLAASSQ